MSGKSMVRTADRIENACPGPKSAEYGCLQGDQGQASMVNLAVLVVALRLQAGGELAGNQARSDACIYRLRTP
jgi:hypothetical protein